MVDSLWEGAVIFISDNSTAEPSEIVVPITVIIANSRENATLQVSRLIPEDRDSKGLQVVVRPFYQAGVRPF